MDNNEKLIKSELQHKNNDKSLDSAFFKKYKKKIFLFLDIHRRAIITTLLVLVVLLVLFITPAISFNKINPNGLTVRDKYYGNGYNLIFGLKGLNSSGNTIKIYAFNYLGFLGFVLAIFAVVFSYFRVNYFYRHLIPAILLLTSSIIFIMFPMTIDPPVSTLFEPRPSLAMILSSSILLVNSILKYIWACAHRFDDRKY